MPPQIARGAPTGTWEDAVRALRGQPEQRQLVLDAYYDDPLLAAAERYHASAEWADVRRWLQLSHGKAIDIGAGRGIASYALAREGFSVTALEPDPSPVVGGAAIEDLATQTELPITVMRATAEDIPADEAQFDVVFARAALHHTDDLQQACNEFFRILKPGGWLIAIREHVISRPEHLEQFFDIHPLHRYYGGENAFLLDVYTDAIRQAGFALVAVRRPLESAMNYAPQTAASLRDAMAQRTGPLRALTRTVFDMPGVWPILTPLFSAIDHRPGRLFSFLARKPG